MKKYLLIGGAAVLGYAYWQFKKWQGTGINTKAGTFTGWLLNASGIKKDTGYN